MSRTKLFCLPIVLAIVALLVAPAWAADAPAKSAMRNPGLKYLPKDYVLVGNFDVGTLMTLLANAGQENNPQYQQFKQYAAIAKMATGIDVEKDLKSVTFFVAGDLTGDPELLVAIRGTFDNETVEKHLAGGLGAQMTKDTYNEKNIYSQGAMGFCFPEDSTILAGSVPLLKRGIEIAADPQMAAKAFPVSLRKVLEQTNGASIVWVATQPKTLLNSPQLAELKGLPVLDALRQVEAASVFFELAGDGLLVQSVGFAGDEEKATELQKTLSDRKKMLLTTEGANVFLASFLVLSNITADGPFVRGSFRITATALEELWNTKFVLKGSGVAGGDHEAAPPKRLRPIKPEPAKEDEEEAPPTLKKTPKKVVPVEPEEEK